MLRYAINIKWPKKLSNEELYEKTKATPWSQVIKKRRLTFLGHIMRRNENTPVRIALKEALKPTKGKRGRPSITWLKTIANDLKDSDFAINIKHPQETLQTLISITKDRKKWKTQQPFILSGEMTCYLRRNRGVLVSALCSWLDHRRRAIQHVLRFLADRHPAKSSRIFTQTGCIYPASLLLYPGLYDLCVGGRDGGKQ